MKIGAEIDPRTGNMEILTEEDLGEFLLLPFYGREVLKHFSSLSLPGVALLCLLKNPCCRQGKRELVCVILLQALGQLRKNLSTEMLQNELKNWKPCFYEDYNLGLVQIPLSGKEEKPTPKELEVYGFLVRSRVENFLATASRWQQIQTTQNNQNNVVLTSGIPLFQETACCKNCPQKRD